MKNILFIASEAVPFIKTGGLADVVGSLPKCFDKKYFDVRVMIPKYLCIKEVLRNEMTYIDHFYMDYLGQSRYVGILQYVYEGITFYFIDNESYFWGEKPYGDWYYDLEKFSFFSQAALSALPVIGWKPDIVHCHDWQTGLIPVYLKDRFRGGEFFLSLIHISSRSAAPSWAWSTHSMRSPRATYTYRPLPEPSRTAFWRPAGLPWSLIPSASATASPWATRACIFP